MFRPKLFYRLQIHNGIGMQMDGVTGNYALLDRSVVGTIDLWNVRGKMPFNKYSIRRFSLVDKDCVYVFVLVIRRFGSTVETCRVIGKTVHKFRNDRIKDLYVENGSLMISTKRGPLRITA